MSYGFFYKNFGLIFALMCGLSAANTYYVQPLLNVIALDFEVTITKTSNIVSLSQIGMFLGLILIVPLGDSINKKVLILAMFICNCFALFSIAISPNIIIFYIGAFIVGISTTITSILMAYGAFLSKDEHRGSTIGIIMGGILFGILLSRIFSGVLSSMFGWRSVYEIASAVMLFIALCVLILFPNEKVDIKFSYFNLLKSIASLFARFKILSICCIIGACTFAIFTAFWTSLTYLLSSPLYEMSQSQIGLFSLFGVGGAAICLLAGKLLTKHFIKDFTLVGIFIGVIFLSFILLFFGDISLTSLIVGTFILDIGIYGAHILNQNIIYGLDKKSNSAIASTYGACFMLGSAFGAYGSSRAYIIYEWRGVCIFCSALIAISFLAYIFGRKFSL